MLCVTFGTNLDVSFTFSLNFFHLEMAVGAAVVALVIHVSTQGKVLATSRVSSFRSLFACSDEAAQCVLEGLLRTTISPFVFLPPGTFIILRTGLHVA